MLSRSHARPTLTVNLARFTTGSGSENRSHYAGSDRIGYLVIRAFSNQRQSKHEDSRMPTKFEVLSSVGKLTVQFLGNMMCILVVEFHEHGKSVNAFFTAAYSSVLHEESTKD